MCNRLGNVIKLHSIYSQSPINIDSDAWTSQDCDRFYSYSLKDLQIEKELPVSDGKINWNLLFLRHYESKTANDKIAANGEFFRNLDKLLEKVTDHKDDILAAVSRTNIAAFG